MAFNEVILRRRKGMKLVYIGREAVLGCGLSERDGFSITKVLSVLDDFAQSECDFAEVTYAVGEYVSAQSAYNTLRAGIERFCYTFRVRMIKGRIYLDKRRY